MLRKPITGIAGCCARSGSGHATTAPPTSAMNSRRLTYTPFYDDETRLSDDLEQGALVIAASRLRLPQWVIYRPKRERDLNQLSSADHQKRT